MFVLDGQAIKTHSPDKPSLIFVASRRQTRLTASDLVAFLAAEENAKMWLHMREEEMEAVARNVRDQVMAGAFFNFGKAVYVYDVLLLRQSLKLFLAFGIGMHHAGLVERDRKTVEELFVNQKIQVLCCCYTAFSPWQQHDPILMQYQHLKECIVCDTVE